MQGVGRIRLKISHNPGLLSEGLQTRCQGQVGLGQDQEEATKTRVWWPKPAEI